MKKKTKKRKTKDPILKISPSGCLPKKARNPADSTLVNVRAANKRHALLWKAIAALEMKVKKLEALIEHVARNVYC